MNPPEISIVIANWNGEFFLREGLRTVLESAKASRQSFEIIVVDDASTDKSKTLILNEFPEVTLLENQKNLGFARTCNRGAREARGRVLVMLNNDMTVPPDFIERLTAPFFENQSLPCSTPTVTEGKTSCSSPTPRQEGTHQCSSPTVREGPPAHSTRLFAFGAKTIQDGTGIPNQLCMTAAWRGGGIGSIWSDPPEPREVTYAQGGSAAYDRDLFLRLGGFDPIFHPGYWEDFDLTYRACKAGWQVLYEPRAVAVHRGKASMSRIMGRKKLDQITERNRLWFNWLNLDDPALICRHILAIPWICLREIVTKKEMTELAAFIRALAGAGKILRARRHRKKSDPPRMKKDRELLHP